MVSDKTLIQITKETAEELKKNGYKGDTYESIIRDLLNKNITQVKKIETR